MPAMTTQEIWTALVENAGAPHGPVRIARAEYLVDAAEANGDTPVYAQALIDVINSYEYGSEQSKMLVPFARLLSLWDHEGAAFDSRRRHSLFWYFKWATGGMIAVPEVPLASIEGWLVEMESRYRQAGHSPRPVHMERHRLAREIGDTATAEREFEAWLDAPRDTMADCHACEAGGQGGWHAYNERDELALELWRPVLAGERVCAEEPHRVLSRSLLPLLRLGRIDEARANHLRGYRMARGVANLRSSIGRHIEFCALTGNEARGLEILAEHSAFLVPGAEDADSRLDFLTSTLILLRRLIALGLGGLELADSTVADTAESLQEQIARLCARFDARNGTSTVSEQTAERLAREPLLASLPLGSSSALPHAASRDGKDGTQPSDAATSPPNTSPVLDELIAEAKRLAEQRHPRARQAWERVGAAGFQLPADVAVHVNRSRANAMMERAPEAARALFTAVAESFDELGDSAEAREVRGSAAFAAIVAGDQETAESEAAALVAEADAAWAAGEVTPRQYLAVHGLPAYIAFNAFARQAGKSESEKDEPADPAPVTQLLSTECELAERLGDLGRAGVYHAMLARLAVIRQEPEGAVAHLEASRDDFLAAGQTWDAADPEEMLGQLAISAADAPAAERHARAALVYGADVMDPQAHARLASLLVEAVSRQPDRHLDLVDAALRAAELWEGLSEPDTLHNRFTAARAYATLNRYGEAAALFDELMPRVHVPYEGPGIAMTREQYGDCLTQLDEHHKAAMQYVAAAALLQDDPRNQVPHARIAWSAAQALQSAGLYSEALPAYLRVAELWGALGNVPARVRCLRSAAWIVGWESSWAEAIEQMNAVLAELEALPADQRSEPVEAEIPNTIEQINQMRTRLLEAEADKQAEVDDAG